MIPVVRHNAGTALLTALVVVLLALSLGRGDGVSGLRTATGAMEQDLVRWEVSHFLDKWTTRALDLLLFRSPNDAERSEALDAFFAARDELRAAQTDVDRAASSTTPTLLVDETQRALDRLQAQRDHLKPVVEETIEGAVSGVLHDLGVIDAIGPLRWPPVDFAFEENGLMLVRAPRDKIDRLDDVLLEPGISVPAQAELEAETDALDPTTVSLVVRVGGVATYPAQVSPHRSLHGTLELVSHEWLHHWLFFRPLGREWWSGGELRSINETVANIFGQEIGDAALTRLTGEVFDRPPWVPPVIRPRDEPPSDVFDFNREMRAIRVELDALLRDGQVERAEEYLEERRLAFVANGFNIRKLNNAWFAFHGTYADSAASVSPIEGQLRAIQTDSSTLAEWLDRIAGIDKPGQLEAMALEAGWVSDAGAGT
jgi:hypothetical protein